MLSVLLDFSSWKLFAEYSFILEKKKLVKNITGFQAFSHEIHFESAIILHKEILFRLFLYTVC